jgi:hypothetical protein
MKKLALVTTLIIAATGAYAETAKSAPAAAPEASAPAAATAAQVKKEHKANHAAKAKHAEVKTEEGKPAVEKTK